MLLPPAAEGIIMLADSFITPEMFTGLLPATMLIGIMFASLLLCFFGYVLFRIELAISNLAAGIGMGVGLVAWRYVSPSGVDYLVICSALGLLMMLMGWFLYRLAFGLLILAASVGISLLIALMYTSATPENVWPYVIGALVGLPLGALAYIYMKPAFIFLSAMGGSLLAIFCGAIVVVGPQAILDPTWSTNTAIIAVLLLAVAVGIGITGIRTQKYLARV
ncbi:hypothetical protein LCGC14_2947620, partial [marine sediment metagenome]